VVVVGEVAAQTATKTGSKLYSEATFKAFERQLAKDGMKSMLKTQSRIQKNLAEHIQKLSEIKRFGGYSSSVEPEIKTFQSQLEALKDLLK
jgi:spermidine synthase